MNAKVAVVGGIVFYLTTFILSMISGPLIHEGFLKPTYAATAAMWRPELMTDPPNMAALLPMWIASGLVYSIIVAALYSVVRPALAGGGWQRGLKFGIGIAVFSAAMFATLHGVFNLPAKVWVLWAAEGLVMSAIGGAMLGLVAQKLAPAAN